MIPKPSTMYSTQILIALLWLALSCIAAQQNTTIPTSEDCPLKCVCDKTGPSSSHVTCNVDTDWMTQCQAIFSYSVYNRENLNLKLVFESDMVTPNLGCLPRLESLDLSESQVQLNPSVFDNLNINSNLNLSHNSLVSLPANLFSGIEDVGSLDLSYNKLKWLNENSFEGLDLLKFLDLSHNNISVIEIETFSNLSHLEQLNLESNSLRTFSFRHFSPSTFLNILNLKNNSLSRIYLSNNESGSVSLHENSHFDISDNAIECSCNLALFLEALPFSASSLVNANDTLCGSPANLKGDSIAHLDTSGLACTEPGIFMSYPSRHKDVLSASSITLECHASGFPHPAVMWITPWGDHFLQEHTLAHGPQTTFMHGLDADVKSLRKYRERNFNKVTSISVADSGHLVISKIRGYMGGGYTCVVFNPAGNVSKTMDISVYSGIASTYTYSLIIGGYCASGFLIFGFIVGFIRMVVVWLQEKNFTVPFFSRAPSTAAPAQPALSDHICSVSVCGSSTLTTKQLSGAPSTVGSYHCPHSGFLSRLEEEGEEDLEDSECEEDMQNAVARSGANTAARQRRIRETIEEARGRLRCNVERKMERVKKNVQHICESGSMYVHNIRETGHSAAHRMRAGVAVGVETVKHQIQSFKELCGTGDMGGNTISMVSVETDVDSHQRSEVVKQFTFV